MNEIKTYSMIDELEAILNSEEKPPVTINADGTITPLRAKDQFDEQTERLLPCFNKSCGFREYPSCTPLTDCPAHYRPAVAAALREAAKPHGLMLSAELAKLLTDKDKAIADLRAENHQHNKQFLGIIANLRAELAKVQAERDERSILLDERDDVVDDLLPKKQQLIMQNQELRAELDKLQTVFASLAPNNSKAYEGLLGTGQALIDKDKQIAEHISEAERLMSLWVKSDAENEQLKARLIDLQRALGNEFQDPPECGQVTEGAQIHRMKGQIAELRAELLRRDDEIAKLVLLLEKDQPEIAALKADCARWKENFESSPAVQQAIKKFHMQIEKNNKSWYEPAQMRLLERLANSIGSEGTLFHEISAMFKDCNYQIAELRAENDQLKTQLAEYQNDAKTPV